MVDLLGNRLDGDRCGMEVTADTKPMTNREIIAILKRYPEAKTWRIYDHIHDDQDGERVDGLLHCGRSTPTVSEEGFELMTVGDFIADVERLGTWDDTYWFNDRSDDRKHHYLDVRVGYVRDVYLCGHRNEGEEMDVDISLD